MSESKVEKHLQFLTPGIAQRACLCIEGLVKNGGPVFRFLKRQHLHVVVLVPTMLIDESKPYPQKHTQGVEVLYEHSLGDRDEWEHPYDEIAQCKALQLWEGRNNGSQCVQPHLLFSGDTPYHGGVYRHGFVVACSGQFERHDTMIAGMVSDMCVSLAAEAYERRDRTTEKEFINQKWRNDPLGNVF